jgi:serine/threonine-protein kinase
MEADVPRTVGLYTLHGAIASGGVASVHLGRLHGAGRFARIVAIKRLLPVAANDPDIVSMLVDEGRLAARIKHPNVVSTLDVVVEGSEVALVMDYVDGESLASLARRMRDARRPIPIAIASAIVADTLRGLHAAHEAAAEDGTPLRMVHRDVSPQNVLVGVDGVARVVDFGVAKAVGRMRTTTDGSVRGKLGYMAPEQLAGDVVTPAADIYAAGVVLWELLTGERLFGGEVPERVIEKVMLGVVVPPSAKRADVPPTLDDVVRAAVEYEPSRRFRSARDMAVALEASVPPAGRVVIGDWVREVAPDVLAERASRVVAIERADAPRSAPPPPAPKSKGGQKRASVLAGGALVVVGVSVAFAAALARPVARARETPESLAAAPEPVGVVPAEDPRSVPTTPERSATPIASAAVRHAGAGPRRAAAGTAAPANGCDVPFRIDADGRRIYKRQCL